MMVPVSLCAQYAHRIYSTTAIKNGDSLQAAAWIRKAAYSERQLADSMLTTAAPAQPATLPAMAGKLLLTSFLLEDWDRTLAVARQYRNEITTDTYSKGAPYAGLVGYAAMMQSKEGYEGFSAMIDEWLQAATPVNRELIMDFIGSRVKYATAYWRNYRQKAGDSVSSKNIDELFRLFADKIISDRARQVVLHYVDDYDGKKYVCKEGVRIRMPDGVHLSATVIFPKSPVGKSFPVIFRSNCYPFENDTEKWKLRTWANEGYAAITVYPRGKGGSEGSFYPFENDAADNYAVIDWISKQSWCNGKVGMYGGSYLGFTQWATVKKIHPALKTIVPQVAVAPGIDYPNPNGVFMSYMLRWIKFVRNHEVYADVATFTDTRQWDSIFLKYIQTGVPFDKLDSLAGGVDTIFQRWLKHPAFDDYWQRMTPAPSEFARIRIPVLTLTGYFDDDQRGAMYYYNMHHRYADSEAVKNHFLLIGPYDHYGPQGGRINLSFPPYTIDSAAAVNITELVSEWFSHTLKDAPRPRLLRDRVNLFVMGQNKWRHFNSLQQMNDDTLIFPLSTMKTVIGEAGQNSDYMRFRFISNHPLDTMDHFAISDGNISEKVFKRNDILVLESKPFDKAAILNGSFVTDLYLSSSVPDADIQIDLWELDTNGRKWLLSSTFQRLSHAQHNTNRRVLRKKRVYHVALKDAHWISRQISSGSKLWLVISPFIGPAYEKNYGSSQKVSIQSVSDQRPIELYIHTGSRYKSSLKIPLMTIGE